MMYCEKNVLNDHGTRKKVPYSERSTKKGSTIKRFDCTSFSELGLIIDDLKNRLDFRYSVLYFQECQLAPVNFNSFELDVHELE